MRPPDQTTCGEQIGPSSAVGLSVNRQERAVFPTTMSHSRFGNVCAKRSSESSSSAAVQATSPNMRSLTLMTAATADDQARFPNPPVGAKISMHKRVVIVGGVWAFPPPRNCARIRTVFEGKAIPSGRRAAFRFQTSAKVATSRCPVSTDSRYFSRFRHLPDTMKRIPMAKGVSMTTSSSCRFGADRE